MSASGEPEPVLKQAEERVNKALDDIRAQRLAAVDQATGDAREMARLATAFFLEAIRAGMPQGEAVPITSEYVRALMQDRAIRDSVRERTERWPLDK